ncbi:MAG: DUF6519 domain-containing protein [Polaromonas sp.]
MQGDSSRDSFNPARHYSAVRLQQGRVITDADWNEQADLTRYRAERLARDTIGPCGAPQDAAGYALTADTHAFAVQAVDANVAWIAGEDGALLRTGDGGASWQLVSLQTSAHLRALAQAGGVGWAAGDGGVLRKTSDAGQSWQAQDSGTRSTWRGAAAFDAQRAWLVGDGGIVMATLDGGASWRLAQTDATRLHAVRFADALNGLAVGQAGAIVASHDGGQTWTAAASGSTAHLHALALLGTQAWAAGAGGTLLRSADAGATWQASATTVSATLLAIGFRDANEGWAVGEGGTVLHSVDGGVRWTLETTGSADTLRGLSFVGSGPGWAVGDGSTALRIGAGSPDVQPVALPAVNVSISPGRCYVNGVLCELEARASLANQPDGGTAQRLAPGDYLMYLNVWQRHISVLQAPELREVALGGPDTATRARTLAQVRAMPLPVTSPFDWNCDASVPGWDALVNAARPRLAARAEPQLTAANLCEIAATAGYQRLENQLYRVEVHQGGANPSFKWSRENGSVAYAVTGVSVDAAAQQTVVRVAARGRDANLDLAAHDRVELTDDDAEAVQRAGVLLEYLNDGDDELELVLAGVPGGPVGQDLLRHPVLRRWDQRPQAAGSHALPIVEGTWLDLEDGVQVMFSPGGHYRPGDYWQIPARTISVDVEWPRNADGDPVAQEPAGVADAYCRLGIVRVDAQSAVNVASDCRDIFPPLTLLKQLLYVGGDGQDGAPAAALAQPLAVRVARGGLPVPGASVRFEVQSGGGNLDAAGAQTVKPTDAQGMAFCAWTLGPGAASPERFQNARAQLLDGNGQPIAGQTVLFSATASLSLQYVSGDGQQGAAGTTLAHALELRVANGVDGIAGATVRATVEQGGGGIVGPGLQTSGPQGLVEINWQLGASGPQRLRAELMGANGQVLQRSSFNATVTEPAGGSTGCAITIGKGGQFEKLDNDLLKQLLEQRDGRLCLCFLPGAHELGRIEVSGNGRARLSVHGCGHTSGLLIGEGFQLFGFAALELRDLVLQAKENVALLLTKNGEVSLRAIELTRQGSPGQPPALSIMGAENLSIRHCAITDTPQAVAMTVQGVSGDCQITHNRFSGIVNFYGDAPGVLNDDQLRRLRGLPNTVRLEPNSSHLTFIGNTLSMLTVGKNVLDTLANQSARGLFASATLEGNTFLEQHNVFVAGLLAFSHNSLLATPTNGVTPYGVLIANRATATGNLATAFGDQAVLQFVTAASGGFVKAANQVFILP